MGEDRIYYIANEGICISKIIDDLKNNRNNIPTQSQTILDQLIKLGDSMKLIALQQLIIHIGIRPVGV